MLPGRAQFSPLLHFLCSRVVRGRPGKENESQTLPGPGGPEYSQPSLEKWKTRNLEKAGEMQAAPSVAGKRNGAGNAYRVYIPIPATVKCFTFLPSPEPLRLG